MGAYAFLILTLYTFGKYLNGISLKNSQSVVLGYDGQRQLAILTEFISRKVYKTFQSNNIRKVLTTPISETFLFSSDFQCTRPRNMSLQHELPVRQGCAQTIARMTLQMFF